ncbi:hypothetical protein RHAB21_00814 [Pseudorhizobium halotolerans]|uniref:Uncharacterized protein n=1 Tax=Pseudorhizobium halotolerans TaxID=1233081 RepID=A0ABN7JZV2_9HYPH|nr:hypothetical protein [Pseudorhizobium halotolerans]CAD7055884.1 hypothetical protein RHAB21_00814 [Pseudorhizobium halotolerans]
MSDLPNAPSQSLREMIASYRKLADDLEFYLDLGPTVIDTETTVSEWAVARRAVPAIIGKMKRHPTIQDGHVGISTEIVFWNLEQRLARSQNRWYRLGKAIVALPGTPQ